MNFGQDLLRTVHSEPNYDYRAFGDSSALDFVSVAVSSLGSMKEKDRQLNFHSRNCNQVGQTFTFGSAELLNTCACPGPFALEGFKDNFPIRDRLVTIGLQWCSYLLG